MSSRKKKPVNDPYAHLPEEAAKALRRIQGTEIVIGVPGTSSPPAVTLDGSISLTTELTNIADLPETNPIRQSINQGSSQPAYDARDTLGLDDNQLLYLDSLLRYISPRQTAKLMESNTFIRKIPPGTGLLGSRPPQSKYSLERSDAKNPIAQAGNGYITIGFDQPSGKFSGTSRFGAQKNSCIDLIAGLGSGDHRGRGPDPGTEVPASFQNDAARIYISELTDIDRNMGLVDGSVGRRDGRSAIGLKADGIRIHAREGIKIVTGAMKGAGQRERSSTGAKLAAAPRIDLIAGNYDGQRDSIDVRQRSALTALRDIAQKTPLLKKPPLNSLQPIVKGDNLVECLQDLQEHISDLNGIVLSMATINTILFAAMGPGLAPVPRLAGASAACAVATQQYLSRVTFPVWANKINGVFWEFKYLNRFFPRYICSKTVRAT